MSGLLLLMFVIGINMNDLFISRIRAAFLGGNSKSSVRNCVCLHKLFIDDSREICLVVWMARFLPTASMVFFFFFFFFFFALIYD